jgi:3-oxoacyl-[acyl-carrier protein] reductase
VEKFVKDIVSKYGRVDVCVANAAGPPSKTFLHATHEDWHKAFEMNFMSVVNLAREVIPQMQKNKWGRLITITSTSVRQPIPDLILSSAIRPAVVGLVKSLAIEFGKDGITANNIAPGYTATERLNELAGSRSKAAGVSENEIRERWASEIPMRRLGEPSEIADAIVWLASERASYVTGQTIMVDGGVYKGM